MKTWILVFLFLWLNVSNTVFYGESPKSVVLLEGRYQIMKGTKKSKNRKTKTTQPNL